MKVEKLEVVTREGTGTAASRQLRKGGEIIPGVVYGGGDDPTNLQADRRLILGLIKRNHHLVSIDYGKGEQTAVIKEVQWDTYSERLTHFDLRRVAPDEKIEVRVPLTFVGEEDAPAIAKGGSPDRLWNEITVRCKATDIPELVKVDVRKLDIGDMLKFADVELPSDVELVNKPKVNIFVMHAPRSVEEIEADSAVQSAAAKEPERMGAKKEEEAPAADEKQKK